MVLGIECFRESDDPDAIGPEQLREEQRKRFKDVAIVDKVMEADKQWRLCQFKEDALKQVQNTASREVGKKMKAKEAKDTDPAIPAGLTEELLKMAMDKAGQAAITAKFQEQNLQIAQLQTIVGEIKDTRVQNEKDVARYLEERDELRRHVGNILHKDVPISATEDKNDVVRTVGPVGDGNRKAFSHVDLIEMIDGVDFVRGTVVSGNRGYFLKGAGVALEQALCAFAHDFLLDRDYTFLSPPVFMKKEVMQEVAQLSQFSEELYKVLGKTSEVETDTSVEEKFLIATAEQPIAAYHRKERIPADSLPIKYAGMSECFRQEVIASPDNSWDLFHVMIKNAEDFCKAIGLSYQVVDIVSGDLNLAAARKYDLEAWFPGQGTFRELVSCSNCTDYQSRRLDIKLGQKGLLDKSPTYVHMLNSTLCATTRMICCILETFQVGDFESGGGIVVPEALRPFMPKKWKEFIPFVAPKPEEVVPTAAKKGGKKAGMETK